MDFENIIVTKEDNVAKITINRPDVLNALDKKTLGELSEAIGAVGEDDETRAVVITGAGRGFCSGADFKSGSADVPKFHEIIKRLTKLEKPVIASLNGAATGAGCDIALACDIRIASEEAKFSEIFVKRALSPDAGHYFLPRLVGVGKAKELIFTGDIIDAKEAERIGLVNKVVPPEDLEGATKEMATRLAMGPTKAIGMAKIAINKALENDLDSSLEYALGATNTLMRTKDFREGIAAFLQKRKPKFRGK